VFVLHPDLINFDRNVTLVLMITLGYTDRTATEDIAQLRKSGFIPGVFYGKKQASTPVTVPFSDFMKVWKQAGESGVVTLKGKSNSVDTLIHDVAVHPLTGFPLHADFYVFEKGKKIEIDIPLDFIGVSPAVKDLSGNLVKVMHEIKVLASPENLPHDIKVDISMLVTLEDHISAKDLVLPQGVELAEGEDDVVASVTGPKAEEIDEPTVAPDLSAIEVEKKGKKEEEEAPATE
jgi:large subunit ribosomal protein L25